MSNSYMYIYNMANAEEATLKHIELLKACTSIIFYCCRCVGIGAV